MPRYKVLFTDSALEGIAHLKKIATKEDLKIMKGHLYRLQKESFGIPLNNSAELQLEGCFKIYFGNETQYRIVYEIINDSIEIIDILAIGLREGYQVYQDAFIERINRKSSHE